MEIEKTIQQRVRRHFACSKIVMEDKKNATKQRSRHIMETRQACRSQQV
jgi:hypothetical protein